MCAGIMSGKVLEECSALACEIVYEAPYDHPTKPHDVMKFPLGGSPYGHVLVGARECDGLDSDGNPITSDTAESPKFTVAAVGQYDDVFRRTDSAFTAHENNGVHWYFEPGKAMGFAPTNEIHLVAGRDVKTQQPQLANVQVPPPPPSSPPATCHASCPRTKADTSAKATASNALSLPLSVLFAATRLPPVTP